MRFSTCAAILTCVAAMLGGPICAQAIEDGCGDSQLGAADIETVFASVSLFTGDPILVVTVQLCEPLDPKVKYRLHIDHTAPFFDDNDSCITTSDDTMKLHRGKATGPGSISVFGSSALDYTVPLSELNPDLTTDDVLYVWVDTQYKGIRDRAPDTDRADGCSKPQVEGEAEPVVVPCVGTLTVNNDGSVYPAVEGIFTEPLSSFGGDLTGDLAWIGLGGVPGSELGCDTSPNDNVLDPLAVPYGESVAGKIALIKRTTCFFETKIKLAQNAGAIGVVVFNSLGDNLVLMGSQGFFLPVTIPGVFIRQSDGEALAALREAGVTVNVTLTEAQCANPIPAIP